jgi:L-asparagine transporter-like permease
VGAYAEFEYWFVMVKVLAVVAFVVLGLGILVGATGGPAVGLTHFLDHGGFLPMGAAGLWLGASFALYSFIGVEVVAVASGEARDPEKTIPLAMKRMVLGLSATYVVASAVLVGVMPWTEAGVGESPFVSVLRRSGISGAAGVMNFVVVTAALSAANANLYLVSRTLFSLGRAGLVPESLGRVNRRGTPVNALLSSCAGLAVAVVVQWLWPSSAYAYSLGVALFGAVLVWFMIFVTHLAFRRAWNRQAPGTLSLRSRFAPAGSALGALVMLALFVTTWWAPGLRVTVLVALPWLIVLGVGFGISRSRVSAVGVPSTPGP